MNTLLENITGLNAMTDQVIAYDFLQAAKTGIKSYAAAITEAVTPEVRAILKKQLDEAIQLHDQITGYLVKKGWYHPYDIKEQLNLDLQGSKTALQLAST